MNKVILMGRLTRDVDVRYTQTTNTMVANFSLAVNRRFVKEGEERQADFFNVTAFGKTAEFVSKYFQKGQQVAVIGRLQNRSWEDDQGQKHYAVDVISEEVYFADSKKQQSNNNMTELENTLNDAGIDFNNNDDLPF